MNYERPELLEKLAGAYVLGTMSARARPRFARLLRQSTIAQRAVARWNDDLAPLARSVPPIQPPAGLWQQIAAKTGPAPQAAAAPATPQKAGWLQRLDGLFGSLLKPALGFALGAVVAVGVVSENAHLFGMHHMSESIPASYVGLLTNDSGEAVLTAGSHRRGETMTVKLLKPLDIPPGKVARLWALPKDGAPVAVANVPASGSVKLHLGAPAEDIFFKVPKLGVTFETDPAATAPGAPFVLTGHCVKFW